MVWYACYGSNINYERFMRYIIKCADKTPPKESRKILIPYEVYFASEAWQNWDGSAVAFLDTEKPGFAYGRAYLITYDQYKQVKEQEGPKYTKQIDLPHIDGKRVYSFTSENRMQRSEPLKEKYYNTIKEGLLECYEDMTPEAADAYLFSRDKLDRSSVAVLRYVKNSEHAAALKDINCDGLSFADVQTAIKTLKDNSLIVQDGRSIRAGLELTSPDTLVYTNSEKRAFIEEILSIPETVEPEESEEKPFYSKNIALQWYKFGLEHNDDFFVKFMMHWMAFNWIYSKYNYDGNVSERDQIKLCFDDKRARFRRFDAFALPEIRIFIEGPVYDARTGTYNHDVYRALSESNSIEALLLTLYQVRCNLFHGSKSFMIDRDIKLVKASSVILEGYLKHLISDLK